jgi:dipeptidyl aminopeptidase/acylaminoacyl peptidase
MLGVSDGVPELEGNLGSHTGVSSRVAVVASFSGVTDLLALIGKPSDLDRTKPDVPEALLIGGSLIENPARATAASPLAYVSANDVAVLTVHGTADRTVPYDQAVRMDTALRQAGVPSYFVTVQGGGHGDFGTAADRRVEAFFARYLRGEDTAVSTAPIKLGKQR